MLEISPVLAGTFDTPDYVPPHNIASTPASTQTDGASSIDSRRYTKFDHSATEAGSTTDFSFGDFLDMINPLQHIPVVSSVYREIVGDKINPVSRIVGDILYGGALGVASGVLGAVGGVGDAVMEAQTGKDSAGNVVASLLGSSPSSSDATPQVASAAGNAAGSNASGSTAAQTPAPATPSPAPLLASARSFPLHRTAGALPNTAPGTTPNNMDATTQALIASQASPLDPKKLPYGGVLDPAQMQGTTPDPMQSSNMALALAASAPGPQLNHMIYAGGLVKGTKPTFAGSPPPPSSGDPASIASGAAPAVNPANPLPPELMQDIASLRAINQYRSTASQTMPAGSNLDVVN